MTTLELAVQHHQTGRTAEAEALYRQVLAENPQEPDALHLLGMIRFQAGSQQEGIDLLARAVAIHPASELFCFNLGVMFQMLQRFPEALECFRRVLEINPNHAETLSTVGVIQQTLGNYPVALQAYQQAVQANPRLAAAYANLGSLLVYLNRPEEALQACYKAVEVDPKHAGAYTNMGNVLKDMGLVEEAVAAYRQAFSCAPESPQALSNIAYAVHFHPAYDPPAIAAIHREWNQRYAQPLAGTYTSYANDRSPERRLRIGLVSPDMKEHPVGRFILPLLMHHNPRLCEFAVYTDVAGEDAMTVSLRRHTELWRSTLPLRDHELADEIYHDRVDILIDLSMHMSGGRLLVFARKPAPVQATYLAYCSTTGLTAIDHRITDPYLDPPGVNDEHYSEKSVYLPESYWCYHPMGDCPPVGPLPALRNGHITFGTLNNFAKVSPLALATWCRLLRELPSARLVILAAPGSHRDRLTRLLLDERIDLGRIHFVARMPWPAYIGLHNQIDLMLDPFPYAGGTTTCDALWMGVPVVSLAGRTAVSRGGLSILSNLGLQDLVVSTPDEYVALARNLAADLPRLAALRQGLRERMQHSPLMDGPRFAQHFQELLRNLWRQWCSQ